MRRGVAFNLKPYKGGDAIVIGYLCVCVRVPLQFVTGRLREAVDFNEVVTLQSAIAFAQNAQL